MYPVDRTSDSKFVYCMYVCVKLCVLMSVIVSTCVCVADVWQL